jgi:hypothetical protein
MREEIDPTNLGIRRDSGRKWRYSLPFIGCILLEEGTAMTCRQAIAVPGKPLFPRQPRASPPEGTANIRC